MPRQQPKAKFFATAFGAALCLVWSLLAYAPLIVLANNPEHFKDITLRSYLAQVGLPAAGCWFVLGSLVAAVSWLARTAAPALLILAVSFAIWLTINGLNWNYGVLAGLPIEWSRYWYRGVIDLVAWLLIISVTVYFRGRLSSRINAGAALLMLIMIAGQIALFADPDKGGQLWHRQAQPSASLVVAPRGNVFLVIFDMLQADIAREVFALRPDLKQALTGFRFYPNTVGAGTTTVGSTPVILGAGNLLDPSRYHEWRERSLSMEGANYLPKRLVHVGYEVCQDGSIGPNTVTAPKCTSDRGNDNLMFLIDVALFRALPQLFKAAIFNQQRWLLSSLGLNSESKMREATIPYRIDANTMVRLVRDLKIHAGAKPRFFWLHFMGTHIPIQLGADCAPLDRVPLPTDEKGWKTVVENLPATESRATVIAQAICYFDRFAAFLKKLRQLAIYDTSVIVVAADHGDSFGNRRDWFERQRAKVNMAAYVPDAVLTAGTPLLMIKPLAARGLLEERMEPATLCDIPRVILGQLGMANDENRDCIDIVRHPPPADRNRRFYHYRWTPETWSIGSGPFPEIEEFLIAGDVGKLESWQPTFNRRVGRTQGQPWSKLNLADPNNLRYLSVAGWRIARARDREAVSAVARAEGRLYFERNLQGREQLGMRLSNLPGQGSVSLAIGFQDRAICNFVIEPNEIDREIVCILPQNAGIDHIVLRLAAGPKLQAELIVHEVNLPGLKKVLKE